MTLVGLIIWVIILGFACWVVRTAPVIDSWFKSIIIGILVIITVIICLRFFGFATGFTGRFS